MSEVIVVYWSGSGNTEAMAKLVGDGIREAGKEAKVISVDDFPASGLADCSVFAMGCPSMGDEELEETIMLPFVEEVEKFVSGRTIGLFGSYGWGDGEWMRSWVERMENAGAHVIGGEGVICNEAPDAQAEEDCRALGKSLAEAAE